MLCPVTACQPPLLYSYTAISLAHMQPPAGPALSIMRRMTKGLPEQLCKLLRCECAKCEMVLVHFEPRAAWAS